MIRQFLCFKGRRPKVLGNDVLPSECKRGIGDRASTGRELPARPLTTISGMVEKSMSELHAPAGTRFGVRLSISACLSRPRYSAFVSGRTPSRLVVVGTSLR